eukprot:CAMPEP_0206436982 /NCGR_PEP_ID=MMETSP0324_2-20121206/10785_1 /ASSEMBLY_ACC=CAM_ASM_000836 /TAXON_ID=2866 /ORGANISM="Crypthecodinium cohnii, Strain Seligo" /LENGTH=124 /DNA_ID=CAMNT_0053904207 /DNA_START=8 /DNA_END=382 /DNA_ORIENTATION=-
MERLSKDELRSKTVTELKDMLRGEGFNPAQLTGIEKADLVEKVFILCSNPVEEDLYPLPLYSNCMPQFVLRALFLGLLWMFILCYLCRFPLAPTLGSLFLLALGLALRNIKITKDKASKRRKRQ